MNNDIPLLISENDDIKRNYVFGECLNLIKEYTRKKEIIEKTLEKYSENEFNITVMNIKNVLIRFKENEKVHLLISDHYLRQIKIRFLDGSEKKYWLVNEETLDYYLEKEEVLYPKFRINNLDYTLDENNYKLFLHSNITDIIEDNKPEINYKLIKSNLLEQEKNKFSNTLVYMA